MVTAILTISVAFFVFFCNIKVCSVIAIVPAITI